MEALGNFNMNYIFSVVVIVIGVFGALMIFKSGSVLMGSSENKKESVVKTGRIISNAFVMNVASDDNTTLNKSIFLQK